MYVIILILLFDVSGAAIVSHNYSSTLKVSNNTSFSSTCDSQLNITVGFVYIIQDFHIGEATLALAEERLRENGIISKRIAFHYCVTYGDSSGPGSAVDLYEGCSPNVMVGPAYETAALTIYGAAMSWNIPIVGYGTQTGATTTDVYKTYVGTTFSSDFSVAILNLVMKFAWLRIGLVDTGNGLFCGTLYSKLLSRVQEAIQNPKKRTIVIALHLQYADKEFSSSNLSDASLGKLLMMKQTARVFVVCPGSNTKAARNFFTRLYELNMTSAEYVYVLPFFRKAGLTSDLPWVSTPQDPTDILELPAFNGSSILVIDPEPNGTIAESEYRERLQKMLSTSPWNRPANQTVQIFHELYIKE